jgi:GxxExxY protein
VNKGNGHEVLSHTEPTENTEKKTLSLKITLSTLRSLREDKLKMDLNELSSMIIKAAINVHKELGPGLLESVYQKCLLIELKLMGLAAEGEVRLPVNYRGQRVEDEGFRIDVLVENRVVVELKSVEKVKPVYPKQLLTYLKLANKKLGLLINFNVVLLRDGIKRIVNAPHGLDDKLVTKL